MPGNNTQTTPRVALVMEVPPSKDFLTSALAEASISVAVECRADEFEPGQLDETGADAVVIPLDEAMEPHLDRVTDLAAGSRLPVIFDDADYTRGLSGWDRNRWIRHLRAKILRSDDTRPALPPHAANSESTDSSTTHGEKRASRVYLLGASIGGPEAVRSFLEALPADVDAAFILVQHMGPEFQEVLAVRLRRATGLDVVCGDDGQLLAPGRVVVAPAGKRLTFDDDGRVLLAPRDVDGGPSPSIDETLYEVAARFGGAAGAIIFSGKDNDGLDGCATLARQGGTVWAQDAATATIAVTPDSLRKSGLAGFSGPPEQLAARVVAAGDPSRETEEE